MAVASGNLQENGCPKPRNSEQLAEKDAKRASLLFTSMSQFNDLDFFLNPQKGSAGENAGPAAVSFNPNATLPNVSSGHSVEACASTGVQLQQWDIMVYNIKLSDDIVALIENFEKSYLAILQNETELISFLPEDKFELLSLPKQNNVDKEITRSHPSLCVLQGILQSKTSPSNSKVLILAEQVFWCSLKSLLNSMGLSWNGISSFCTSANPSDAYKMDSQLISDCWLVSQEIVSASFPFNKFNLVVEYGGFCGSSREGEFHSILALDDNVNYEKLEDLLNFVPIENKYNRKTVESGDNVEAHCMPLPVAVETNFTQQRMLDIVIIVNTQNFDKEMIVSRRSTYQKILAMEKE
ncbi:hypothetical protein REPUB_Repub08aG0123000 [Reevesia pubescens]